MPMLADLVDAVIGVDTHTDTHTAAVVDRLGAHLATVSADAAGYARLSPSASRRTESRVITPALHPRSRTR
jgi:transposase